MENRIDLDALEAALAKATPGEWKWSINSKRVQVAAVRHAAQVCAVWNTSAHPATAVADAIVSAHNALPALIAELRELRAENAAIKARAWQSIETAPKNGTGFLAWNESLRIVEASWWSDNMAGITHWQPFPDGPTHVLPLPPAPEAQ